MYPFQGLLGVAIPAEAGGIGGTFIEEAIVQEEQSYAQAVSPNIIVHSPSSCPTSSTTARPNRDGVSWLILGIFCTDCDGWRKLVSFFSFLLKPFCKQLEGRDLDLKPSDLKVKARQTCICKR